MTGLYPVVDRSGKLVANIGVSLNAAINLAILLTSKQYSGHGGELHTTSESS